MQFNSFGHGVNKHNKIDSTIQLKNEESSLKEINNHYLETIKPLFKKACFNCHSSKITYPWYYNLPGIKQLIDRDIREAKKHLDFSNDFPFQSHDSPENDLLSISKSLSENKMPPLRYRIMHSNENLNDKDIQKIQNWIRSSIEKMKNE